jgi:hypothetical protein
MEGTNYSRSDAPKMDKIAIKLPANLTPNDPSPTLTRIQGEGSAVPLSRSGREAAVALSRSAGIHTLREVPGDLLRGACPGLDPHKSSRMIVWRGRLRG